MLPLFNQIFNMIKAKINLHNFLIRLINQYGNSLNVLPFFIILNYHYYLSNLMLHNVVEDYSHTKIMNKIHTLHKIQHYLHHIYLIYN